MHQSVAEEYVARLSSHARRLRVADPASDPTADLGPLINQRQLQRVRRIVEETVRAGARLHVGGPRHGLFYNPTVLSDVTPMMPAFQEEIFGPVAPVTTFANDEEALTLAGMTDHGLVAAVHSRSSDRALALAESLGVGMVHVNDQTVIDIPEAPFGGCGQSGNGSRFGGDANWEAFTQWQWVTVTPLEDGQRTDLQNEGSRPSRDPAAVSVTERTRLELTPANRGDHS